MSFFQAKRFRPFRASLFVTLGLWGAVPIIHARLLHGPDMGKPLVHSVAMGLVYMVGLTPVIYLLQQGLAKPPYWSLLALCLCGRAAASCDHLLPVSC